MRREPAEQLIRVFEDSRTPGQCRGCGSDIEWFETFAGKRMPMNPGSVPRKSDKDPETARVIVYVPAAESHFRTCPDAAEFRRR